MNKRAFLNDVEEHAFLRIADQHHRFSQELFGTKSLKSLRFQIASGLDLKLLAISLVFLSLLFWEKHGKPSKKARIFSLCWTPKIPGKEGQNAQKSKEIPGTEKNKEIPKKQGKEDQGWASKVETHFPRGPRLLHL